MERSSQDLFRRDDALHWRHLSPWADERLDEVALDTHRLLPSRLVSAVIVSVLVGRAIGPGLALVWLAALLLAEGMARLATGRFRPGVVGSPALRAAFVMGALPINLIWAGLGATLWLSPIPELKLAAVGVWVGQIVFTQNYRHQPWVLVGVSAFAPLASLVVFPFFFYDAQGIGADTARFGLLLVTLTTINVMISNRAAAHRLDELTHGLREERERALEAARAKSTFIAMTSHELRTPMNGLLGMAHALERSTLSPQQRTHVELMIKSGDNLMQVLNDVLDLSKIDAGKVELASDVFNLSELVRGVADGWRDAAEAKGLSLTVEITPGAAEWVSGDALRVRQVLMNLVSNGLKFTDQGGVSIRVETSPADPQGRVRTHVRVSDTGIGVRAGFRHRIFDSFTQSDDAISRRHGGTGLGLTISRALALQMAGDLVLEDGPTGATFLFTLLLQAAQAPEVAGESADRGADLDDLRVLVAEDNAINQLVVRMILEAAGPRLTVTDDGQAAPTAPRPPPFDARFAGTKIAVGGGRSANALIAGICIADINARCIPMQGQCRGLPGGRVNRYCIIN